MNWWLCFIGIISIISAGVPGPSRNWEIWSPDHDQIKHSAVGDEKKQETLSWATGELFTFWKPESASERESKAGYMCWVLVLADTRRDNCVKYHIQTSTNCFFISFDKPVKTPPVSIDKALTESGSQFLDSLSSSSLWPDTHLKFYGD